MTDKKYPNMYARLVGELGEIGAREEMARRRSKVKKGNEGWKNLNKEQREVASAKISATKQKNKKSK